MNITAYDILLTQKAIDYSSITIEKFHSLLEEARELPELQAAPVETSFFHSKNSEAMEDLANRIVDWYYGMNNGKSVKERTHVWRGITSLMFHEAWAKQGEAGEAKRAWASEVYTSRMKKQVAADITAWNALLDSGAITYAEWVGVYSN